MNTLKKLQQYMGNRKALLPVSMALSALSALAGMLPYILIWFIVRELLAPGETIVSGNIETYAWSSRGQRDSLLCGPDGVTPGRIPS